MKKVLLLFVVLFWWISPLDAAYPNVRNFHKGAYRAGAQNWDIAQSAGGCMYFANNSGLLEFDGGRWDSYPLGNGTAIRSLKYVPEENRLYAGAFDEFGYYEPGPRGRLDFISMKHLFPNEDLMTDIWRIHKIENSLFFCADGKIFRYFDGRTQVFGFDGSRIDASASVYNSLLVSTPEDGPMILSGDIFIPLPGAAKLAGKKVCAMLPWYDMGILIVTHIDGIFLYNGSDIVPYRTGFDRELREGQVYCAALQDNTLALGTIRDGLFVIDTRDGTGTHCNRAAGLQNNTVLSLFFDADTNLWLGTDNGIDYLMLDQPDYSLFSKDTDIGAGYCSLIYGNNLFLGTNQGLFYTKYVRGGNYMREVMPVNFPVAQVWHLSANGNTLFCGHDQGLLIMDGNSIRNIRDVPGVWKVMPLRNNPDMMLGCSYQGLFVLRRQAGEWRLSHRVEGLNESSGMFVEDSDGSIWFSHWVKGLFRLRLDEAKENVVSTEYFGMEKGFPTERYNIPYQVGDDIIFSSEGGFYVYDPATGRMVYEERLNHLFRNHSPVSIRIHDLGQGDLVFVSDSFCGLAYPDGDGGYKMDSLSMRHIAGDLIIGFENLGMLDDQTLLISNLNGFSVVDLARIKRSAPEKPNHPVFIKSVWGTNRRDSLIYGERDGNGGERRIPRLPSSGNSIRIEAVSPEYRDQEAVEYSFLLDGYDSDWSSWSPANTKEYTHLAGGDYELRVKARNNFTQAVSETELGFSVAPPWFRTNAALTMYILAVFGAAWFAVRYAGRRSDRRVGEMKKLKEVEIKAQKHLYEEAARQKEKELVLLQNRALEYDLRDKSRELASSTLNLIRKNEILMQLDENIGKVLYTVEVGDSSRAAAQLRRVQKEIRENIEHDSDWEKFEHNFDMVYENYLKRLSDEFPQLNLNDKRLCAYLRMDLQSKDIAPLMNISVRSVEMARYRLRRKMGLSRDINLSEFLQKF